MNSEEFNEMVEKVKMMELEIALITGTKYIVPTNSKEYCPESEIGYDECYDYETGD